MPRWNPRQRTMDPDRFQMKDLKRRLTSVEKQADRLENKLRKDRQLHHHEIEVLQEMVVTLQKAFRLFVIHPETPTPPTAARDTSPL